ncbi:MAG: hypothetical protein IKQ20_14390 [Bacteroidales bacterium]|nr:hypothetical protein [Bacteroidales bacterium]
MKKIILAIMLLWIGCASLTAQKWYQVGFKIGTSFPLNRDYSVAGDRLTSILDGEFNVFFRAGKVIYGEVGLGYAFYKGDYSNANLGFSNVRVETRHLLLPVKAVANVKLGKSVTFLPAVGIIYQPILKVTDNNINYNKKTINTNQTLLAVGFDFKFGPIVLGTNYRYSFKPFFRELDGAHFQYINICAGFQF